MISNDVRGESTDGGDTDQGQVSPNLARDIFQHGCSVGQSLGRGPHKTPWFLYATVFIICAAHLFASLSAMWQTSKVQGDVWNQFYFPMLLGINTPGLSAAELVVTIPQRETLLDVLHARENLGPNSGYEWLAIGRGYGIVKRPADAVRCLKLVAEDPYVDATVIQVAAAEVHLWNGEKETAFTKIEELYRGSAVVTYAVPIGIRTPVDLSDQYERQMIVQQSAQLCVAYGANAQNFSCALPIVASRCACGPAGDAVPGPPDPAAPPPVHEAPMRRGDDPVGETELPARL